MASGCRFLACLALTVALAGCNAGADESPSVVGEWTQVDSLYCTVWLAPGVSSRKVEREINTFFLHGDRIPSGVGSDERLGQKCDIIFKEVERALEMYPPGLRVTMKIYGAPEEIEAIHAGRYGFGVDAEAFYMEEDNTIYTTVGSVSTSVVAHEMAHSIMSHYFTVRPPRKIEEWLAMQADAHLGE